MAISMLLAIFGGIACLYVSMYFIQIRGELAHMVLAKELLA